MEIRYYKDYVSQALLNHLKAESREVAGVPGLRQVGDNGKGSGASELETPAALAFLCQLHDLVQVELNRLLEQRIIDRKFIDERTHASCELNRLLKTDFLNPRYETVIGQVDGRGRKVVGPVTDFYCRPGGGAPVAPIPDYLEGPHVTLFGPPDDAKLSINAMNAFHRKLKDEPAIVAELLSGESTQFSPQFSPMWGADDEDSKTPLRRDLVAAGENLAGCFDGTLSFTDAKSGKAYGLEASRLALPIKRFPGLALPCLFFLYQDQPLPLHLYDFALHLFRNWSNPRALVFYVPKLENEEEARYIRLMMESAETLIQKLHPEYRLGTIRLMVVLENPRAIFRVNEIMDELHPYFVGASLGWHDYLASTARLFKEDANYRIPVKADPDIVIKYIKASHDLLAEVVGSRGGIKVGGMYGILPMGTDIKGDSFQVTIRGFIKDVITQLKRDLTGFWVAHPDFVRIGMALVQAWKLNLAGDGSKLTTLVTALLDGKYHGDILNFISGPDLIGLDRADPLYARALLVADMKESSWIANNHPNEIRYNIFQSLQYLADWLTGNGCVALPAQLDGVAVRVMDDLATAERSRWEVWHELHHGRFSVEEFLKIAHEEYHFIQKDLSDSKKIVQVKWTEKTARWYPIALNLMIELMTRPTPPEFATELLLPFTVDSIRNAPDPWKAIRALEPEKYQTSPYVERFVKYFAICGSRSFAQAMAKNAVPGRKLAEKIIREFTVEQVNEAAGFHGDIGESRKTLDALASHEQALVLQESEAVRLELLTLGEEYRSRFGMKFLISAQGKSASDILSALKSRFLNTPAQELDRARSALWEITSKRLTAPGTVDLADTLEELRKKHQIVGATVTLSTPVPASAAAPEAVGQSSLQTFGLGEAIRGETPVQETTLFQIASLSKTFAVCFAIEYFKKAKISPSTSVNALLAKTSTPFRLQSLDLKHPEWAEQVTLLHLMSHGALNMHYVKGVPASKKMPRVGELLLDGKSHGYDPVGVLHAPGTVFQYSGGGFLVLEHLIESLENRRIQEVTAPFFQELGLSHFTFEQASQPGRDYAAGYSVAGEMTQDSRLMFPAFAAGAMSTSEDVAVFLNRMTVAYSELRSRAPLSHYTAVQMFHGPTQGDQGCRKFMGVTRGLGLFIAEAGKNRLALHQGANEGYRCLYVHCFKGPDAGMGFVLLCSGELNGVLFIAEAAQAILKTFQMEGIDPERFQKTFLASQVAAEEIVNTGYKELIFSAFERDRAEEIVIQGQLDPRAKFNRAVGARVLEVTNERFARVENLLSDHLPVFDPELFGRQGKIMDSWESVRHNPLDRDVLVFELRQPSKIQYVSFSTQFHLGNHPQSVKVEASESLDAPSGGADQAHWSVLVPQTALEGHSLTEVRSEKTDTVFRFVRVSMFPDGGLSRLGLFDESLPVAEQACFQPHAEAKSVAFAEKIPHSLKPLAPHYEAGPEEIEKNWQSVPAGSEMDVACSAFGGKIVRASNEHYSPATQIISPYPPIHMFDGMESARSRISGHFEDVVVEFLRPSVISRIEVDFSFFVNNNPLELSLEGGTRAADGSEVWKPLVSRTPVKAYAGNAIEFVISSPEKFTLLRAVVHPDGGINRLRVYSRNY
ncbi:MAG: serine hydrolase [Methylotenera sp.]|nr:serine hydrolase [Oligoflexia bacterium]